MSNWRSFVSKRPVQLALAALLLIGLLVGLWNVRARFAQRVGEFVPSLRPTPVATNQVEQSRSVFFLPYIASNPSPLISAPVTSNPTPTPVASTPSTTDTGELLNIPLTPITLVLIALVGIVLVWLLPLASVPLLIVATVLNRYRFDVASLGIRIEHVALLAVAVVWTINFIRCRERFRFAWDDALLALYWFIALVASFLNAPSFKESLKFLGLMGLAFLTYWFVKTLVTDEKDFRRAFVVWLTVGVGEALFGIIGWLVMPLGINLGVWFYPYGPNPGYDIACRNFTYSPYGTLFEPNIFGSYTMGISLILLTLWLSPQFKRSRKYLLIGIILGVIAVAVSLTRGALAGFGLGALAVLLLAEGKWKERLQVSVLALVFLGAVVFGVTELSERLVRSPLSPVSFRLSQECVKLNRPSPVVIVDGHEETPTPPVPTPRGTPGASPGPTPNAFPVPVTGGGALTLERLLASESVGYRLDSYVRAFNDWLAHPWIGNGANVFAQKYITTSQTRDWISNVELMSLHDTGVIGTSVLLLLFIGLGRDLIRVVKKASPGFTRAALLAMALGFLGLLVAYQVTTAFWLGFTWVQLGLMRAAMLLLSSKQE